MELFRKSKSKYYWYHFTVRGERYRGSTKETNETGAQKAAALKLGAAITPIQQEQPAIKAPPTYGIAVARRREVRVVRRCAQRIQLDHLAPHDLRRTCAKLCHMNGGELEQIQFLLGHVWVLTTERCCGAVSKAWRTPSMIVSDAFSPAYASNCAKP